MLLLIPGPVATDPAVRAAMNEDFAPWDNEFRDFYARLRERVRVIAGGTAEDHMALTLPGCGHFALEAALRSFVPAGGRILVPITGSYAERMARLAREAGREVIALPMALDARVAPEAVAEALAADPAIGHVGLVYSETSSGVVHDPCAVGAVVRAAGRRMVLDAVSAFGALPLDLAAQPEIDATVFTANKCLEGVPGAGFIVARRDRLGRQGGAGSWSFDLADVAGNKGIRFTPPAQVLKAFAKALDLHAAEGGQPARLARYTANMRHFYDGMREIGLTPCLAPDLQGPIVVNIGAPDDPAWDLQRFVDALKTRGILISNFYNTPQPSFRTGCIGAVTPADMDRAVAAMDAALDELGIRHRRAA